jgi:pilus assembly protein Flp/PilA
MLTYVKNFVREEEGATMVEYGLMVALIAVACIVVVGTLGGSLNTLFGEVDGKIPATIE